MLGLDDGAEGLRTKLARRKVKKAVNVSRLSWVVVCGGSQWEPERGGRYGSWETRYVAANGW